MYEPLGKQEKKSAEKEESAKNMAVTITKALVGEFDIELQAFVIKEVKAQIIHHYENKLATAAKEFEALKAEFTYISEKLK